MISKVSTFPDRLKVSLPIFLILVVGFFVGCAPREEGTLGLSGSSSTAPPSEEYETLEKVQASELFPMNLLKSETYHITDDIVPDVLTYHFTIESSFGRFEAYGEDMLRIRVKELKALAELRQISPPEAFGAGVAHTLLSPFKFLWNLATSPKETVMAIPEGISRAGTRIGEMIGGERGQLEDSETEELVGFSLAKREIASKFGVDVYTSNEVLQEDLNDIAWAAYAGGMGSRLATVPITGPVGFALMGTTFGATMNDLLREQTPEDLRQINREELLQMGAEDSAIEAFLAHPWFSPRHETILVHALAEMVEVDHRGRFLQVALGAKGEEEALFFQRLAEMLARYHRSVIPIDEILLLKNQWLVGFTLDDALVAALPFPRLLWTSEVAKAANAIISTWESAPHHISRVELWITGQLTPRAKKELESRGFMVHERMLDRLMASLSDEEADPTFALLAPSK